MYVGVASVTTLSWIMYKPDRRWARHRVPLAEFIALYVGMYWATYVCRYLPTSLAGAPAVGYLCTYAHMYVLSCLFYCTERGPERPREAQRGPERPGEAQRGPERPREAQRSPESRREAQRRTERPREAQRGSMYICVCLHSCCVRTALDGNSSVMLKDQVTPRKPSF